MKRLGVSLLLYMLAPAPATAGPAVQIEAERHVLDMLGRSDVTALVRITGHSVSKEYRDDSTGRLQLVRYQVDGEVVESFRGAAPGPIRFHVYQEPPSSPPTGEHLVSLCRVRGVLEFADDGVFWVRATPGLVDVLREGSKQTTFTSSLCSGPASAANGDPLDARPLPPRNRTVRIPLRDIEHCFGSDALDNAGDALLDAPVPRRNDRTSTVAALT